MSRRAGRGADSDALTLAVGEIVATERRRFHVNARDLDAIVRMRGYLIAEAQAGATITYGELVRTLDLPCAPKGLGRLLVLLSEDCARRGEPTLAAIVVTQSTGEVGDGYGAGAAGDRHELFDFWSSGRSGGSAVRGRSRAVAARAQWPLA